MKIFSGGGRAMLWVQAWLRVDARKWMLPKEYGDKTTEITGDANTPLITLIELIPIDPTDRRGFAAAI